MKLNLEKFAREAAAFGGLRPEQVPGLVALFSIVEEQAFCDGVRIARGSSFATDPAVVYLAYAEPAPSHPSADCGEASTNKRPQS